MYSCTAILVQQDDGTVVLSLFFFRDLAHSKNQSKVSAMRPTTEGRMHPGHDPGCTDPLLKYMYRYVYSAVDRLLDGCAETYGGGNKALHKNN